jgi:hypothetical protein
MWVRTGSAAVPAALFLSNAGGTAALPVPALEDRE